MSSRHRLKKFEEKTDINISPMIDMVFILLIFFIVTTVFVEERGLDVDKPTPQVNPPEDKKTEPVVLRIARNSQVLHQGEVVSLNRVETLVKNAITQEDVPVILQVERGALAGIMIQVMDRAKLVGAKKVSVTAVD
jgi:biopolymer transport protein ExbD